MHPTASSIRNDLRDNVDDFSILKSLSALLNNDAKSSENTSIALEVITSRNFSTQYSGVVNSIFRQIGLYPKVDTDQCAIQDLFSLEMHRAPILDSEGSKSVVFHREQAIAYQTLLDGHSLVLSAPTSFGKSILVDAVISECLHKNILIVVPTISLIDETRRRMYKFSKTHKIITHPGQAPGAKNIYVLTQERALDLVTDEIFNLFVIDEFYKLDEREGESLGDRAKVLNAVFYKYIKQSDQFLLIGPNIESIPTKFADEVKCKFIFTRYSTVHVNVALVNTSKGKESALLGLRQSQHGQMLVFCSSQQRAVDAAILLASSRKTFQVSEKLTNAIEWIADTYHQEWSLVSCLSKGVAFHHASLPRSIAQMIIKWFNDGILDTVCCTSTIIEGVNTAARHVAIFDSKINKNPIDYFTYCNIKGRSGRFLWHDQGSVWLFEAPPNEQLPFVDFPIFTQNNDIPSSLLLQIPEGEIKPHSRERYESFKNNEYLGVDTLRSSIDIEPETQILLAKYISENSSSLHAALSWQRMPTYDQLEFICELMWKYFIGRGAHGAFSAKQLAFRINELRNRTPAKSAIQFTLSRQNGFIKTIDDAVRDTMDFRRHWASFKFPRLAMTIDRIQKEIYSKAQMMPGDYTYFSSKVENLFFDSALIALDEHGIPLEIARKIESILSADNNLDSTLEKIRQLNVGLLPLTEFEKSVIIDAQRFS